MKFLADENIRQAAITQSKKKNIDILHCTEINLKSTADEVLLTYASENNYIIVTCDADFERLHSEWQQNSKAHAGIIYFSMAKGLCKDTGIIVKEILFLAKPLIMKLTSTTRYGGQKVTDKPITLSIEHLEAEPPSGKPRIAGRRITVEFLSTFIDDPDWPVEKICHEYHLTPAQVYAAWSYYYDHKDEIDRSLAESEARIEQVSRPTSELPGYDEFMSEQP